MTTEQAIHYRELSADYMRKARAHLAEGDLTQASEKGWGAAAVLVKPIAEQRGWRHDGHRQLWQALQRLATETGDEQMRRQFGLASSLHMNYYEAWLDTETVAEYLNEVERLIRTLEALDSPRV